MLGAESVGMLLRQPFVNDYAIVGVLTTNDADIHLCIGPYQHFKEVPHKKLVLLLTHVD